MTKKWPKTPKNKLESNRVNESCWGGKIAVDDEDEDEDDEYDVVG